ncbi:transcriptional regulator family: SGT1 [Agaricus bisporus var. burnettii]|uniref:Transcriptional regulator family: SGT1 n=1 Tax=Agaricus bisporus var. burnettii TaxID=192524 RepID=A0A8H7FBD0_AGABI|nr:transcriptional regulator family: SGT1 [Agaricus bisporus var. burnettii]
MDIFNRPPSIAEDTVHYALYPPPQSSDKLSVTSLVPCIHEYVDELLHGFIWHRDAFEVKIAEDPNTNSWFLEGQMRVGDCIDDEWYTVWLLREISSKWDLVISVYDSDGEFLLIEAAQTLPSWVEPSNAENRVWIYRSRLHLIPISHVSPPSKRQRRRKYANNADESDDGDFHEKEEEYICVEDALNVVRDSAADTFASARTAAAVWERISRYPEGQRDHMHTTRAYIPVDIAKALLTNPSLVQKAVETFYTRDAIQLRAAHRMSRFPPSTNVLRSIKMTRPAYAQLVGQKFFPPKIFGQWKESEGSKEYKWKDTGMKIAVGFEMLYQESKGRSAVGESATEESKTKANIDALRRNQDYIQYIQNLVTAGYFKGEQEGSQLWSSLEAKAANAFIESRSSSHRQSFASQVSLAISESASVGDPGLQEEDDETWLNIDAEEFENKMERALGQGDKLAQGSEMDVDRPDVSEEDRVASEQATRLKDLASKVEQFVEGEGDIEGALFEDEELSDESLGGDSEDDMSEEEQWQSQHINYEHAGTREAVDKLVTGLAPHEYGKMPSSYYSNSQKVAPTTVESDVVAETPSSTNTRSGTSSKPIRAPILMRDKYEGIDSDDETDEEIDDDESEEERPEVVGEVEIDMGEEEEEFLEFARQTLGISDKQWKDILQDRKERNAFIPKSAKEELKSEPLAPTSGQQDPFSGSKGKPRVPQPGPRPNLNPELDSFETVMGAMDIELSRLQASLREDDELPSRGMKDKGKGKEKAGPVEDEDIEADMEAELKVALEREGGDDSGDENEPMDYNLIKNFLESFKSQAGLSGPASNLAGRLQPGFNFPRDDL